jgi:glyoxylase-like metal-dependent hydrolase (beta-lactamase superfamily II)
MVFCAPRRRAKTALAHAENGCFWTDTIYALPEISDYIRVNGQKILDARNQVFGNGLAASPTLPEHDLDEGIMMVGGICFEVKKVPDGESDWQTIVRLPDQGVLFAFDLVFPQETHLFTVAGHFDHWISLLQQLKTLSAQGYDTILIGHGLPVGFDVIDGNVAYLETAKVVHAGADTPEDYATRLKAAYPEYYGAPWVDFSSLPLYGVINP